MWYTVLVDDAAVGTVELPPRKLAAGRMAYGEGYRAFAARIRAASRMLLAYGVYGPPISARRDPDRRRARVALAGAASLRVELARVLDAERAATVFVNLIESPVDGGVIVVALFDDAPATVAVDQRQSAAGDAGRRPWPEAPVVRRRTPDDRSTHE